MKFTLSQILKIAGSGVAAIGGAIIVFAEVQVFESHWIATILVALGAAAWFAGVWEAKHEAAIATKPTASAGA